MRAILIHVPHLQKHQCKAAGGFALQHNGGVLPVAVLYFFIDIFIGQIDAARKRDPAVDHHDLAVVAVIVMRGNKGHDGGKHLALNAQLAQLFGVDARQRAEFTGAVIHQAHFHPFACLTGQNFQDLAPHMSFFYDKIL